MLRALLIYPLMLLTLWGCASHSDDPYAPLKKHHVLEQRVDETNHRDVRLSPDGPLPDEPYRFWEDETPKFLLGKESGPPLLRPQGDRITVLALSGGGANGAYGAGVLNGLYHSKRLPEFDVVTGISAGALIAPFAFLGDERLDDLHTVMLSLDDEMVLGKTNFLRTLIKDAFSTGEEIQELIAETYPASLIDDLAQQHRLGRRLFIGTSHIEAGRLMIWNIGAIAGSSLPNRIQLIHQIIAASAAIPGVFPPQFIPVYLDGKPLEEMHVDGGVSAQVFFNPAAFDYGQISEAWALPKRPKIYVVRNGFIRVPYQRIKDRGVDLLKHTVSSMMVRQTRGDLFRIGYIAKTFDFEFAYTAIEGDFDDSTPHKKMFDPDFMARLYQYGYDKGFQGTAWVLPPY